MKFESISIKNFRGLKNLEIEDFKNTNLLVGKNNSGKSSVLESIFLCSDISNTGIALSVNQLRGLLHNNSEDFKFIFNELDYKNCPTIEGKFDINEQIRHLCIKPNQSNSKEKVSKIGLESIISTNIDNDFDKINGLNFNFSIKEKHQLQKEYTSKLIIEEGSIITEITKNYKEKIKVIFVNSHLGGVIQGIYKYLDAIITAKQKNDILEILKKIEPKIIDISLGANNIIYCDIGAERLLPINLMGDGIKQILGLLVSIYFVKDGVFLIDEIDNGLHYSTLKTLWKGIFLFSDKYKVQIFATTHSDECVRAYAEVYQETYPEEDNMRLYRIQKNADDTHKAVKMKPENIYNLLKMNWEYR